MFKEITRKLYGDDSAHGLYPHNTQVAQLASTNGPALPEGERSFTTLVSDRSLAQLDYDNAVDTTFKTEDHLSTAFGLAALMQNGFPPPGAILNPVNFNMTTTNKQSAATNEEKWQATEEILAWNSSKMSNFTAPQKLFKVKTKQEPGATLSDSSLNNNNNNNSSVQSKPPQSSASLQSLANPVPKRYNCVSCPYSTDRRDLFTRHENIHKEEKPFHCYACLKQFNRADHVKKHFLRMHRDMTYDINKTRRNPPKTNYFPNQNAQQSVPQPQSQQPQVQPQPQPTITQNTINIPTAFVGQVNNGGQFGSLQVNHSTLEQQNVILNGIGQSQNQVNNLPNG